MQRLLAVLVFLLVNGFSLVKRQLRCRCLDAAHGESIGTVGTVERAHVAGIEKQSARIVDTYSDRRGRQGRTLAAYAAQDSRRRVAVARSRGYEQSLGGMPERMLLNE